MSFEVTGITPKGFAAVKRAEERFKAGWDIEKIAEAEGMDEATLRVLIAAVNVWESDA